MRETKKDREEIIVQVDPKMESAIRILSEKLIRHGVDLTGRTIIISNNQITIK